MSFLPAILYGSVLGACLLLWARWRFGATLRAMMLLRCVAAAGIIVTVAGMTAGWVAAAGMPPELAAAAIGVREEAAKLLFFLVLADRDPDTRTDGDRFLAMATIAAGVSVWESVTKLTADTVSQTLFQAYMRMPIGLALHGLLSLATVGFLILSRRRSRFWLFGLLLPMALHSLWDDSTLIGPHSQLWDGRLRLVLLIVIALLPLLLARSIGLRPGGSARLRFLAPATALGLLSAAALMQIGGVFHVRYLITVHPFFTATACWWVLGLDTLLILVRPRLAHA